MRERRAVTYWMSLLKCCVLHSSVGDLFHPGVPYSLIDEAAMLVSAKLISNDASPIKVMESIPMDVPGVLPAAHPEKAFVEVVVTNEDKHAFS